MIYLDNAATTKPFKEHKFDLDIFFNPSSAYATDINNIIFKVKKKIAIELSAKPKNVIFTSGGTEANNLAIRGFANKKGSKFNLAHLGFEHKSIISSLNNLKKKNYNLTQIDYKLFLNNLDEVIKILKKENITFLVLSHIYSESGIILPIEKISRAIKREMPNIYIHVDAVQTFLKRKISLENLDSISISAHKIHGLKGIGALILKNNQKIAPILLGGKQNENLRAGTENIFGIISFDTTIDIWKRNRDNFSEILINLREYFDIEFKKKYLSNKIIQITPQNNSNIITLAVKNIFAEHIIRYLESKDIFISSGSACNNTKDLPKFLNYIKIPKEYHNGILRISFSIFNTKDNIDILFIALDEALDYF